MQAPLVSAPDFDDLLRRVRERAAAQKPAPPASEAELARAEESLGFPLPPLLRRLYAEIGDGGFGPGTLLPLFTPPHLRNRGCLEGVVDLYHAYREAALEASLDEDDDDASLSSARALESPAPPLRRAGLAVQACVDSDRAKLPVWHFEESGIPARSAEPGGVAGALVERRRPRGSPRSAARRRPRSPPRRRPARRQQFENATLATDPTPPPAPPPPPGRSPGSLQTRGSFAASAAATGAGGRQGKAHPRNAWPCSASPGRRAAAGSRPR